MKALTFCLAAVATLMASPTMAATAVNSYTGGDVGNFGEPNRTIGFTFNVSQSLSVTSLGVFDFQNDGLTSSHQIGIWDGTGLLLGSATIGAGSAAALIDGFRYIDVASLNLSAGQTYTIGVERGSDNYIFNPTTVTTDPLVTLISGVRSAAGTNFIRPTEDTNSGRFGPNFRFNPAAAVPEPSAWAMMMLGFGMVGYSLRRKTALRFV